MNADRVVQFAALGLLALALAGCGDGGSPFASSYVPPSGATPIVRATERGTAMLTLIACPMAPTGGSIVAEMIRDLQTSAPVVTADARGTARLVINTCASPPTAEMITAAAGLQRRR